MEKYRVTGMSCAACSARVEKAVSAVEGVTSCSVNLLTNSMGVEGAAPPERIIAAVEAAGYGASKAEGGSLRQEGSGASDGAEGWKDTETPRMRRRLIVSLCLLAPLMYVSMGHTMWGWPLPRQFAQNHVAMGIFQLLLTTAVMVVNQKFFVSGFRGILHGAPNMDTLVALGAGASYGYSVFALFAMTDAQMHGDGASVMRYMHEFYFESAATILTLITVGKMLETRSKGKTTNALKSLMKLSPKTATVVRDGQESVVAIDQVRRGDCFVVRPGEMIPVDGIVLEGSGAVNEAALTGESVPVDKETGDAVSAATLNQSGFLRCEATRVGEDTTLSQIIRMVSDAAATKAPIAKAADRVSGVFVPAVILVAAVAIAAWLLAGESVGFALARGISVLVISCPCALGLATPVAVMVGNGRGAKHGILFKTALSLEEAGKARIVALDKTGTITSGEPQVTDIVAADGCTEEELLWAAFALEQRSEHPLARAVLALGKEWGLDGGVPEHARMLAETQPGDAIGAAGKDAQMMEAGQPGDDQRTGIVGAQIKDFQAFAGNGLAGNWRGERLIGGSRRFLEGQADIPQEIGRQADALAAQGKTPLFFAWAGRLLGMIAVADVIREDSPRAIRELQDMGLHVVMLTGDNERTARAIGREAGVDEVIAGVLPEGKESTIRELRKKGKVAMVGDGINDAPALTRADVGIAIGAGTDVAIDAADVVLMKSRLMDVPAAIRLSRATLRNIHENLFWAFIYNVAGIPLAAGVWIPLLGLKLNPMFGAAAMILSSFCVVSNALRLNFFSMYDARKDKKRRLLETEKMLGAEGFEAEKAAGTEAIEMKKAAGSGAFEEEKMTEEEISGKGMKKREESVPMEKTIKINGMMCGHCEAAVKKALEAVEGVEEAVASHEAGTALVKMSAEVPEDTLRKAVEAKDYEVTEII